MLSGAVPEYTMVYRGPQNCTVNAFFLVYSQASMPECPSWPPPIHHWPEW